MSEQELRGVCRDLLAAGTVDVVVGFGTTAGADPYPVFITDPEDTDHLVLNDLCYQNLTTYLARPDVRRLGRPAVVVKACDARAILVLESQGQPVRGDVYVIGVACAGVGHPRLGECRAGDVDLPLHCDVVIGNVDSPTADAAGPGTPGPKRS